MKKLIASILLLISVTINAQNNALQFDGIDDNVKLAYNPAMDFNGSTPFSIEMWFKTSTTFYGPELTSNTINDIPGKGITTGLIYGKPYICLCISYPSNCIYVTTTNTYNDGVWHHIAYTYNGSLNATGIKIYIDGVLQTVSISNNSLSGNVSSGSQFNVGGRNNYGYYMTGFIDELRFWSKELCQNEIVARKNCELLGTEPQLLAYYNFNQGVAGGVNSSVTNLIDISPSANTGTLLGFSLNSTTSNWISSTNSVTGNCNYNYVSITGNTTICNGGFTTLTATGATTYSWNFGSTSPSVALNPTTTTTYSLYTNNSFSCSGITTATVNVNAGSNPTISVMASNSVICSGSSINLSAAGANTYSWSNSSVGSFIVVSPTVSTNYIVTGTNTLSGCAGTNTLAITVNNLPSIVISSSSPSICSGVSVNLGASGATSYSWNTSATTASIIVSPTVTTNYNVVGTNTATGCSNSNSLTITVVICNGIAFNQTSVEVLTIFPNPSNGNISVKSLTDIELNIINELGQIVKTISLNDSNNKTQLINNLAEGVYFITSNTQNKLVKQKFIILK